MIFFKRFTSIFYFLLLNRFFIHSLRPHLNPFRCLDMIILSFNKNCFFLRLLYFHFTLMVLTDLDCFLIVLIIDIFLFILI
jgi:hypothetical protein